jgi:hypothetical protein
MNGEFHQGDPRATGIKWQDLWTYSYDPVFIVNDLLHVISANPSAEKLSRDITDRTALPDVLKKIAHSLPVRRILQETV